MKLFDSIDKYYVKSARLNRLMDILFIINIFISIVLTSLENDYLCISEIVIVLVYLICKVIDDHYFWYEAEKERRKDNISNGFNIEISEEKTEGYYNNEFKPSFKKYVVNVFESNYFSREISKRMIFRASLKCIFALMIFTFCALSSLSNNVLLVIVQVLFSAEITEDAISIICYYFKISSLYEKARNELITVGIISKNQYVWLLEYCMEYENIKSYYKVRLNSKIYNSLNENLSNNWDEIKKQIKFHSKLK